MLMDVDVKIIAETVVYVFMLMCVYNPFVKTDVPKVVTK